MSRITENSIWPNGIKDDTEGYTIFYPLGTNKVTVPASKWPKGDKYISPFVYENEKLVGFIDSASLTLDEPLTIYLPYEYIDVKFPNIEKGTLQIHAPKATTKKVSWKDSGVEDIPEAQYKYKGCKTVDNVKTVDANYKTTDVVDGVWSEPLWDLEQGGVGGRNGGMFYGCSNLTSFSSDLSNLTSGIGMFYGCSNLASFSSDLSNLRTGEGMFYGCSNLTLFSSDLSNLTDGGQMFQQCSNLTSFSSDLSSLRDGINMFYVCEKLASFSSDLSNLTEGNNMFSVCVNLTSFSSDLSSLRNGNYMFDGCSNLTSFSSDLSSLRDGYDMFDGCKLDTVSVQNIANTINNTYNEIIHIGIGNTTPNEQEIAAFNTIASKGWTVYVNGSSSSNKWNPTSLIPENGEETTTPIPYYAKPVPTDEEHARYVDAEGNFFDILGGQFIYGDSLESYGMFTCEADAAQNMRLTPYSKSETNNQ